MNDGFILLLPFQVVWESKKPQFGHKNYYMSFRFPAKNFKWFLLFSLLFTCRNITLAQDNGIAGRVTDSSGEKGLNGAKVRLVNKSQVPDTLTTATDQKGQFFFKGIPTSPYRIIINYTGYKEYVKDYFRPSAGVSEIDLGDIVLSGSFMLLEEVVIEAPPILIKEDTIEYRADAFKVKPNASTEDLLKKLPGVQVDRNGNITAQGKQVTRIKVNGKDFFTGDPKTASRELPAELIDKVQVIDDYGDQAAISGIRDGESEKIINLQLRKDKNNGWFGRGQAGVGSQERYQAGVNANYFNNKTQISFIGNANNVNQSVFNTGDMNGFGGGGGQMLMSFDRNGGGSGGGGVGAGFRGMGAAFGNLIGGNNGQSQDGITDLLSAGTNLRFDFGKRNAVYGSYVFTERQTITDQFTSQQNLLTSPAFFNITNQQTINRQGTHRVFMNAEIWIDSFNYLKISPNLSVQNSRNLLDNLFDIVLENDIPIQKGANNDTLFNQRPSFRSSVLFNHRFKKRGRNFSFNFDIGFNQVESEQMRANLTGFFRPDGSSDFSFNQQQKILQSNRSRSFNLRAVYSEPIMKEHFLDLSYNLNRSFSGNDRQTYQYSFTDLLYLKRFDLSNAFENDFDFTRFGVGLRRVNKKYNYTLGIQMQPVTLRGYSVTKDSIYKPIRNLQVFPVARLTYNFTRTQTLNITYNGSAQQPSFSQLQPVRDVTNPQFQSEGNPDLRPTVSHTINASFNQFNLSTGRILFTSATFSFFRDQIVNNSISIKNSAGLPTGAQLTRPENQDGAYNINLFYTYSRPWKNRTYVLTILGTLNYNHNINLFDSVRNIGKNRLWMQGFNFDYNYKEWLELSAGARYNLNYAGYSLPGFESQSQNSWVLTADARADLPADWIFRLDFDYTINRGLAQGVIGNIALLNASIEKDILAKKNGNIKFQVFDLLNQNVNITRSVSSNFITDSRVNRLTQFFMVSFQYRLNKFRGQEKAGTKRKNLF